jgi:cation:H+ antiporter
MALAAIAFVLGAAVSLGTSWVLVSRLERVGERLGLSEALLGIVAALAADTPEITASITALSQHQKAIGAGVVIGSNVFNLAALLGLGAVVAGFIALHRKVVLLGGVVGFWVALVCLAAVQGALSPAVSLVVALVVVIPYLVALGLSRAGLRRLPLPDRAKRWIGSAVDEEELELAVAVRPMRGRPVDALVALGALVMVVVASVAMERGASLIGRHFHVADAVIGGIVLAAVTSLPNAVAAMHLARRGRGAAAFSTALNSNNLNVLVGLLVPGVVLGLSVPSTSETVTTLWFVGLTALTLGMAYCARGLGKRAGWLIIVGYAAFVVVVVAIS